MVDVIRAFLLQPTPNWLTVVAILLLVAVLARQHAMARRVARHARSIANMDAWADETDERLERVDWIKTRQRPANDTRGVTRTRRAG
ncbi:hypothetical protein [Aestuariivirga sp.]|uniref:hypothetical protein n=1 Tax=Aestuariivirga sp. TaxID=2650926 RepID=UPI00391B33C7